MSIIYEVHIKIREPELVKFINNKVAKGEFSPSLIFRDAVKELKKQDDEIQNEKVEYLKERLEAWQEVADKQRDYLISKGLLDDFINSEKSKTNIKFSKREIEIFEKKSDD